MIKDISSKVRKCSTCESCLRSESCDICDVTKKPIRKIILQCPNYKEVE